MGNRRNRYGSYHGRSRVRTVLKVIIGVLAVILAVILVFFFLQENHMVYSADGLRFDLPFLKRGEDAAPTPTASEPLVIVSATPQPTPSPTPEPVEPMRAVLLPRSALSDGTAEGKRTELGANAVVFDMKADDGTLGYVSGLELAKQAGASAADPELNAQIETLNRGELYTVARVSCFRDNKVPYYDNTTAIRSSAGNWRDAGNIRWMNPYHERVRAYVTGVCVELAKLGFDEILLDYSAYPVQGRMNYIRTGESYDAAQFQSIVSHFYKQVKEALADYPNVRLSIHTDATTLVEGNNPKSGQSLVDMVQSADRIWAELGTATRSEAEQALTRAGAPSATDILVPVVTRDDTNGDSWAVLEP